MPDSDDVLPLFSPEQAQAIREAIAGFGELAGDVRAAMAAAGARLLTSLPPETSATEEET